MPATFPFDPFLTQNHKGFALQELLKLGEGFHTFVVDLPDNLPALPCALYGPDMGDAPIPRSGIPGGREVEGMGLISGPFRPIRKMVVVGEVAGENVSVAAAYGSPVVIPSKLEEPRITNPQAMKIWVGKQDWLDKHALTDGAITLRLWKDRPTTFLWEPHEGSGMIRANRLDGDIAVERRPTVEDRFSLRAQLSQGPTEGIWHVRIELMYGLLQMEKGYESLVFGWKLEPTRNVRLAMIQARDWLTARYAPVWPYGFAISAEDMRAADTRNEISI